MGCRSRVQLNRMALVTWSSPYVRLAVDSHFNPEETKTLEWLSNLTEAVQLVSGRTGTRFKFKLF